MKTLIIIPTYNEIKNIENLILSISSLNIGCDILVVDDNSPDGTGKLVDDLTKKFSNLKVIHRKGKLGLGTAYIEGFKYALKKDFDYICEMDADFSHNPKCLPIFLEAIKKYDLVLGSRYINGISVINWGFGRLLLSKIATLYVKLITGLPVTDATGGFKCFKSTVLKSINLNKIYSNGYAFQIEMTYRAFRNGFKIGEIPIIFENRRVGQSKMSKKIAIEAIFIVWRLQIEYFLQQINNIFNKAYHVVRGKQFLKFCVVGVLGVSVNLAAFTLFNSIIKIHYLLSSGFAFSIAVLFNFILNKFWTFKDYDSEKFLEKLIKYVLTNIGGLLINLSILFLLVRFFTVSPILAQLVGISAGTLFNFIGSKKLVFKK